jgi:hypothetical protein
MSQPLDFQDSCFSQEEKENLSLSSEITEDLNCHHFFSAISSDGKSPDKSGNYKIHPPKLNRHDSTTLTKVSWGVMANSAPKHSAARWAFLSIRRVWTAVRIS